MSKDHSTCVLEAQDEKRYGQKSICEMAKIFKFGEMPKNKGW